MESADAKILNLTIRRDTSDRYFVSILVETDVKPRKKAKAELRRRAPFNDVEPRKTRVAA
jgi:hypothetical protein